MDVGGDAEAFEEQHPIRRARLDDIVSPKGKAPAYTAPEEGDYCRICRGEASEDEPLFYPCKCSGSIKYVHQACLMEWLSHSQKKYCELCKTSFRFTKLYDPHMPPRLPTPIFIRQVLVHGVQGIFSWLRVLLVAVVWLGWLPWSMRQVWRVLFYLVDCRWSDHYSAPEAQSLNMVQSSTNSPQATTNLTAVFNGGIANVTFKEGILRTLPGLLGSFAGFFVSNPPFLVLRIAQAVFPRFYRWTQSVSAEYAVSTSEDGYSNPITLQRDTLLGGVSTLKALTKSPTINNTVIDILEGQILCLSLVVISILLFLIREWVINQQPGNAPNNENVGQPGELRPVPDVGEADGRQEAADGRNPVPAGERAAAGLQEEGSEAVDDSNQPDLQRLLAEGTVQREIDDDMITGIDQETAGPGGRSLTPVRPTLTGRNSTADATSIRRSIEEQNNSNSAWPGLETFKELWERAEADPAKVIEIIELENRQDELGWIVSQMERLQRESIRDDIPERRDGNENGFGLHDGDSIFRHDDGSAQPIVPASKFQLFGAMDEEITDPAPPPIHSESLEGEAAEFRPETPHAEDSPFRNEFGNATEYADELEDHISAVLGEVELASEAPARSLFDRIIEWLWTNDLYEESDNSEHGSSDVDDERVVEDIDREAPFVPVGEQQPLREQQEGQPAEDDVVRDPEVEAAAAEAGIDINNVEVAEDLEDLDGILELIGLNGPITGLIQNVIFSQFLISLTLVAGVGIPFIWGMLALDILSNPIGVFVRLPITMTMTVVDIVVDTALFVTGLLLSAVLSIMSAVHTLLASVIPRLAQNLDFSKLMTQCLTLVSKSGARLEKTLLWLLVGDGISLPQINMDAHKSLHHIEASVGNCLAKVGAMVTTYLSHPMEHIEVAKSSMQDTGLQRQAKLQQARQVFTLLGELPSFLARRLASFVSNNTPATSEAFDTGSSAWSGRDRALTVMLGYCSIIFLGVIYLEVSKLILRLKKGEKVPGLLAEVVLQAGGVLKVILIIGIEMIVFPFYCGLLLDIALLPLFADATLGSRIDFFHESPFTALFVHWFIGTCYMFHFALFVSMCRKIMRKGVLYFIRDPEDPTFHPVRDVLERNVATQLSKIAFSALVYGGLVMVCLGGVVWSLSCIGGVLPLHWSAGGPTLEFPYDFLFYSFILPSLLRYLQPSKKLDVVYKWWFRRVARSLRLSDFLFGAKFDDERGTHGRRTWRDLFPRNRGSTSEPRGDSEGINLAQDQQEGAYFRRDGRYVRTPASDSVRIPKGRRVFVDVNENNERIDNQPDKDDGPYGRKNDQYTMVYIPPWFRVRIALFIIHVWLFTALLGVCISIMPLSTGRVIIKWSSPATSEINDIYAFTLGLSIGLALSSCSQFAYQALPNLQPAKIKRLFTKKVVNRILRTAKYTFGLLYLGIYTFILLPLILSLFPELYILSPAHTYLLSTSKLSSSPAGPSNLLHHSETTNTTHVIHLVQTWVFGILILSLIQSFLMSHPQDRSIVSTALKAIISGPRHSLLSPNVSLATRAIVIPTMLMSLAFFTLPLLLGYIINRTPHFANQPPDIQAKIYQYSYPGCAAMLCTAYCIVWLQGAVEGWKSRIRDEVYLVGERLHNFGDRATRKEKKGKGKAKEIRMTPLADNGDGTQISTDADASAIVGVSSRAGADGSTAYDDELDNGLRRRRNIPIV